MTQAKKHAHLEVYINFVGAAKVWKVSAGLEMCAPCVGVTFVNLVPDILRQCAVVIHLNQASMTALVKVLSLVSLHTL